MKTLLIASAAFAAMILTSVTADARGFRGGGGGFRGGGGGFHGGGFRGGGFQGGRVGVVRGGYRGGVAGGYRGGYGRYGYRPGVAAAGIGIGAAAAYGLSNGGSYSCGSYHYYDANSGTCQPY